MGTTPRVLVVDDDAAIRGFLLEVLTDEGYDPRVAGNGIEALDLLETWRPALILLDLRMPHLDGLGFRAAQLARPELAHVPVIVFSATRDLSAQMEALAPTAVLPKPFDLDALLTLVRGCLDGHMSD